MYKMNRINKKKFKNSITVKNNLEEFCSWLQKGLYHHKPSYGFQLTKALMLKNGVTLSVQASSGHYSLPRVILPYKEYTSFEIGYPSEYFGFLKDYAENPDEPTDTVYAYVPKNVISHIISMCGGVVGYKSDHKVKYLKVIRNKKVYFQKVWVGE